MLSARLTSKDINRIYAIQKLIGAAVAKAEIYSNCMTTLLTLGMFLDGSQIIGTRTNIIDDDFIHSMYDVANMVPPLDSLKRHLDF